MTHALIVGPRGAGKSTLIRRVLKELNRPLFGFETKKEDELEEEGLGSPIYIYRPGVPRSRSGKNLTGYCYCDHSTTIKGVFDQYAAEELAVPVPEGHVVVMDELGFMERGEKGFCKAVLSLLDGDRPVIAAVKDKELPFLDEVRSHPKCRCFYLNRENRDMLYQQVLDLMQRQTGCKGRSDVEADWMRR